MSDSYEILLKDRGLSLTSVRFAVLQALEDHPHSDAASIFGFVQNKITTASKQAIYNNLNALVEHGIVREIKPKGQSSLYEMQIDDNHHHLVCRECEQIVDVNCHGHAPCLTPINDHGFALDEAEVIFWGICPSCQKNKKEE